MQQRAMVALQLSVIVKQAATVIELHRARHVEGAQDGHIVLDGASRHPQRAQPRDLRPDPLDLPVGAAGRRAIVLHDARVELLTAAGAAPPAEVDDGVRAVRDGLVRPEADHARWRRAELVLAVDIAALQLVHPKACAPVIAADDIMPEGGLFQRGDVARIHVVGDEIEVARHLAVVNARVGGHIVVRYPRLRVARLDDLHLLPVKGEHLIRLEAAIVQHVRGAMRALARRDHLVKRVDLHAPEAQPPRLVERRRRRIVRREPAAERSSAVRAHAPRIAELVVGLPGDDVGMMGIVLRHGAGDAA